MPFVCEFVIFVGFLLCRRVDSFVRRCRRGCSGGGYKIFGVLILLSSWC